MNFSNYKHDLDEKQLPVVASTFHAICSLLDAEPLFPHTKGIHVTMHSNADITQAIIMVCFYVITNRGSQYMPTLSITNVDPQIAADITRYISFAIERVAQATATNDYLGVDVSFCAQWILLAVFALEESLTAR